MYSPKLVIKNIMTYEKLQCKGKQYQISGQQDPLLQAHRQIDRHRSCYFYLRLPGSNFIQYLHRDTVLFVLWRLAHSRLFVILVVSYWLIFSNFTLIGRNLQCLIVIGLFFYIVKFISALCIFFFIYQKQLSSEFTFNRVLTIYFLFLCFLYGNYKIFNNKFSIC